MADPLHDRDNGPLTGIFGFAESTEGSLLAANGDHDWSWSLISSSHDVSDTENGESLRFDGETTRLDLSYRRGLSSRTEVGIEIPYVWHESGSFDNLIEGWHDFFGFPNGSRKRRLRDQIEFFYSDGQLNPIDISSGTNGPGDIRIFAGWQLMYGQNHSMALRLAVKLPTGDSEYLLGSGGTDVSLGIAGDARALWSSSKLSWFYRLNLTYLGEPDYLADRYHSIVGQFSSGMGYKLTPTIDLRLQARLRSAVYDSAIKNLGETSITLTFGANIRLSDRFALSLSMGEDINVDSAPDVSVQIALSYVGG